MSKSKAHHKSQPWHLPGETWRDIPGWEKFYQVSDFGRVRGLKRVVATRSGRKRTVAARVLRPKYDTDDYLFVTLHKGGERISVRIHRLVALAFIGGASNDEYNVHHLNGVKTDNRSDNLEYMHWIAHRSYHSRGAGNGNAVLSPSDVVAIKAYLDVGCTQADLARKFGVHHSTISCIRRGKSWQHLPKVYGRPRIIGEDLVFSLVSRLKQATLRDSHSGSEGNVIVSDPRRFTATAKSHSLSFDNFAMRYSAVCRAHGGELAPIYLYQGICIGSISISKAPYLSQAPTSQPLPSVRRMAENYRGRF